MIEATVDLGGPLAMLRYTGSRLDDPRALLERAGELLREYEGRVFASRGLGDWEQNDPATVAAKGDGRVLVDTGGLLADLTRSHDVRGESVVVASRRQGGLRAQKGDHGPVRNPAPAPPASVRAGWADELLGFLVERSR